MYSLTEARDWIGTRVDDVYGSRVGQVVDVYFDPDEDEVHWMLIRAGAAEGGLTLVPVDYLIANRVHVWVPLTKDLISRAPTLDTARALSRDDELKLCLHYGGLRRRGEVLRGRPADALTAVPDSPVAPFSPEPR